MKVSQVMHSPAVATTSDAPARQVATELAFHRFSGMPVTDEHGHVVGVISEADILGAMLEGKDLGALTASDVMTANPTIVRSSDEVNEVLELLEDRHVIRLPVVDNGRLVGIISRSDLIRTALHADFKGF